MLASRAETSAADEARRRTESLTRIVVRPIGSPTALGLYGLATGTLVLAGQQLDWVGISEQKSLGLLLIAFPFLTQLLASIWGFLARDAVAGTAMGLLALTWLSIGLVEFSSDPGSTSDALGLLLLASATAMALTGLIASLSKIGVALVFITASIRFALGAIHQLTGSAAWEDAAGIVGVVLYVAFAAELEDAHGRTVLPLGRRMRGSLAVVGSLEEQMKHAPNEAGVRQTL